MIGDGPKLQLVFAGMLPLVFVGLCVMVGLGSLKKGPMISINTPIEELNPNPWTLSLLRIAGNEGRSMHV